MSDEHVATHRWARFTKWSALAAVAGLAIGAGVAAVFGAPIWAGLLAAGVGVVAATIIARQVGIAPSPLVVLSGAVLGAFLGGAGLTAAEFFAFETGASANVAVGSAIGGTIAGGAMGGLESAYLKDMLTDEELDNHRRDFQESIWGAEALDKFEKQHAEAEKARETSKPPSETKGFVRAISR